VPLKKLSVTDEQARVIIALVSKKVSGKRIAEILKESQTTIWRNMEFLGLNTKKQKKKKQGKKKKSKKEKLFSWNDFKHNSLI